MIDFKQTIIRLHKRFPEKSIEELLEIMDCIVEEDISYIRNPFSPFSGNPITSTPNKIEDTIEIKY